VARRAWNLTGKDAVATVAKVKVKRPTLCKTGKGWGTHVKSKFKGNSCRLDENRRAAATQATPRVASFCSGGDGRRRGVAEMVAAAARRRTGCCGGEERSPGRRRARRRTAGGAEDGEKIKCGFVLYGTHVSEK
jgi:hypothetical protein